VSNTPDGFSYLPQIGLSGNGTILLAWQDNSPTDDIYFSASSSGGLAFTDPVDISNTLEGSSFSPVLASSGDYVYVTWQDTFPTNDVYVVSSNNGGSSFNDPVNISDNSDSSVSPVVRASESDSSKAFVSWSDATGTENGFFDIFYSETTDGGSTFSEPVNISNNLGTSTTPQIALDSSDNLYVSWSDDVIDPSNSEILLASSNNNFDCPVNISNNPNISSAPLIAVSPASEKPSILWQDPIDPLDPGNTELVIRSSFDVSSPLITIDAVKVNSAVATTAKWGTDTIEVSGTVSNSADGNTVSVDWGDGTGESSGIPISGCTWGPVSHQYDESAISLNPISIRADLIDSGDSITTSQLSEITILGHGTTLDLNRILSNKTGSQIVVSGTLIDSETEQPVAGRTISFEGTGADNVFDPAVTDSSGSFSSAGAAPSPASDGLVVQARFAGDEIFNPSVSESQSYDSVSESAITFNVTAGSPPSTSIQLTGFGFDASIDFGEVLSDGVVFVAECETPDSSRYTDLGLCLQISPAVELAPETSANVTMSYGGGELPPGTLASDIDIFHEDAGQTIVDVTSNRNLEDQSVTGTVKSFSKFMTAIALHHESESLGSHRQQIYVGDGNLVSLRDTSLDQNSSGLAEASFDKQSYRMTDHPVLTIVDSNGNVDSSKIDIVHAAVRSETSDPFYIELVLTETGINTGIFEGNFGFTKDETSSENGVLEAKSGDKLSVNYISGVRASAQLDGVIESGLVELSDYILDEGLCLKPIGGGFNLDLVDAQLGPGGNIKVTISYANSILRGFDPSDFRLVH